MGTKLAKQNQINIIAGPPENELPTDLYDCAICYDKIQPENNSKTKCGHYFCRTCLDAWLNINTTCPMCRNVIRQHEPISLPRIIPVPRTTPRPRTDQIPEQRREIVIRNIMERYTWEQYFMAANDLINNKFIPDFNDINKSSFASANFGDNLLN
jgi:hypothetical protein